MNKNIRCVVIKQFTLQKFGELENLKRYNSNLSKDGELYINDEFNCTKQMADYLMGGNKDKEVVVKVIEFEPEKVEIVFDNVNANQPIGELKPEVKRAIEYINEEIQPKAEFKKTNKKKKSSKK